MDAQTKYLNEPQPKAMPGWIESTLMKRKSDDTPIAKSVDEYLAALPEEARVTLEKIRKAVKAAAPLAAEVISYQMPMYKQNGMLVGFAAFKDHCSLFPGSTPIEIYKDELQAYKTSKGTIQFPIGKPLPAALVKKLVTASLAENEARLKKKARLKAGQYRER